MDASWLTATDATTATDGRVTFPSPSGTLNAGAGLQRFRVGLRKTTGTPNPTVDVELWESGAKVGASLLTGTSITSTTHQIIDATWDASSLAAISGANVECRVVATVGLGSTPTFVNKGTTAATIASSVAPTYPASMLENDLLILVIGSTTPSTANTITALASPWVQKHALEGSDIDGQLEIWYRFVPQAGLSGTLSITVTTPATNAALYAQFYAFRGVNTTSPFEGGALTNGTGTTVSMPSVTTTGVNRLAVAFSMVGSSTTMASATGETGGDWTETVAEDASATGNDGTLGLQSAAMAAAGTISGGTFTVTTGGWAVRGFALKPLPNTVEIGAINWIADYTAAASLVPPSMPTSMLSMLMR